MQETRPTELIVRIRAEIFVDEFHAHIARWLVAAQHLSCHLQNANRYSI